MIDPTPARPLTADETLVRSFLLRYRGTTKDTYASIMRVYTTWCTDQLLPPLMVTRLDLETFALHLEDRGLRSATIATYLSVVKVFYRLLASDGVIPRDPAAMLRKPRVQNEEAKLIALEQHDFRTLMAHTHTLAPARGAAITLMLMMGMRVSEVAGLNVENTLGTGQGYREVVFRRKGGRTVSLPMSAPVIRAVEAAVDGRTTGPLIRTRTGNRATRHDLYRWVRKAAADTGIADITHPHTLRRTTLTTLLELGVPVHEVQRLAGHANSSMTERYDRRQNRHDLVPVHRLSGLAA